MKGNGGQAAEARVVFMMEAVVVQALATAVVIAAIGCRQGMAVAGDVESLGRRVTAAVVQAIFAIIFLDAVFAMFLSGIGV